MSEPIKRTESRFNESWPIGLLQACPRCGNETHNYLTQNESLWFDDFTAGCYRCNHSENRERWNLRPVEHKLEQQIAQLTKERDEAIRSSGAWASTAGRLTGEVFDLRKERDQLAAKCASYKHVIQLAWEDRRDDSDAEYVGKLAEAKCNDQCGTGWASPEKTKVLVEAVRRAVVLAQIASDWDLGTDGCVEIDDKWVSCFDLKQEFKQALEMCK